MLGPAALFTPSAPICAMGLYNANSQGLVYRVSKFQSKDEQALNIPRVKDRVGEVLNAATSDAWFNFPEEVGIAANLGYGSIYGLHKSLR